MKNRIFILSALVLLAFYAPVRAAVPASEILVATALLPAPAVVLGAPPPLTTQEPAFDGFLIPSSTSLQFPRPLPSPAVSPGAGKALFNANLALMIGLNAADYFSTVEALKYPGLEETNPLMKPFVKSPAAFAAIKIGTTALSYWSMKAVFKKNKTMAWVMTTATNAVLSFVVVNNMRLVQQARSR